MCKFYKSVIIKTFKKIIILALIFEGIPWVAILRHQTLKDFLEKSKQGDYVDAYDRNIQYIQNIILKQTLSINTRGFFQPLTDDELLLYFYSKLEIPQHAHY